MKIYDNELEEVEEFKYCFNDTLETFPLIKGKYDEEQEESVQCNFKVILWLILKLKKNVFLH